MNLLVQNYKTKLKQNIRIIWSGISLMADYLAVLLSEMIAIYFSEENLRYIDLFVVIPFIYIAFIASARTYRRIIPFWQRVESLFYSSIYSIIAILLFFFVRANSTEHSIAFLALLWLASFICLVIMRYLLKRILDERNIFQIPLLIIGAQEEALAFTKSINNDIGMSSYKVIGLISDKIPVKELENYPLLGDFNDIEKIIKATGINNVLIAVSYLKQKEIQKIVHRIQPLVKNICIIPNLQAIPMGGADLETFFDEKFMLIKIRNNLARNINKFIKLIFDIVVGVLICIPVIPIIIACAIWVKLDSKGPIFYNAKRIGKNGKKFTCYKFRSMYVNSDELLTQYLAENPEIFLQTNVIGTSVLMDACRKYGNIRYHQVSTDEVYGDLPLDRPDLFFTETTPLHTSSPYSASKASADLLVQAYYRTYKLPVTISRCSNNYGPYHFPEKLIPLMIANALNDKKLPVYGKGENVRDWLYVEDHCSAIDLIIRKGKIGEVYNIGGHNERTNLEVVKTIIKELGKSEDLIEFVTDRPGHDRRYAIDPTKIHNELGWLPATKFDDGIKKTIDWYLTHKSWWEKIISGECKDYYNKMHNNR